MCKEEIIVKVNIADLLIVIERIISDQKEDFLRDNIE